MTARQTVNARIVETVKAIRAIERLYQDAVIELRPCQSAVSELRTDLARYIDESWRVARHDYAVRLHAERLELLDLMLATSAPEPVVQQLPSAAV